MENLVDFLPAFVAQSKREMKLSKSFSVWALRNISLPEPK